MQLYGVMMVRNEADIIEASVRCNLSILDRLVVIDHSSFDGTSEILQRLSGEKLPLWIVTDPIIEFQQSARTSEIVRTVFQREPVDFVFPLDADEFLKVPSRAALEVHLRQVPPGMHAQMVWQTYVPDSLATDATLFTPSLATRRLRAERHGESKVAVARHFVQRPREFITGGNHLVWNIDHPDVMSPHAQIPPSIAAVAHVPVRSRRQLEKKIIIGYLSHLATRNGSPALAYHWRDIYQEILAGKTLDPDRLREIACNYGLPREIWQPADAIELIADPIAGITECRYRVDASPDTLQLLMRFSERLATSTPRAYDESSRRP
jgi:hypothetical protein